MLFSRRIKPHWLSRMREVLWPRSGFRRALTYVGYRVVRLPGTPYAIAGGFAWGAAVSFTPFIGLHFILGAAGALLTRSSVLASAIGTLVGNPWTFPLIWTAIYRTGLWVLGRDSTSNHPLAQLKLLFGELWHLLGQCIQWVFGLRSTAEISSGAAAIQIGEVVQAVLLPMTIGCIPFALLAWLAFYVIARYLVEGYQRARRRRRARRAERSGAPGDDVRHIGPIGAQIGNRSGE